ncbi:hypothetical protein GHT06_006348 [Daphnia sinensis]|uniref:Uncharacterized protein n=1 Tax=Daphnia sinensis TaxID=1820382 RepID=A0AAD5KEJ0_9CRUS|nr:hypothetical protein GHT06_006344 [Daphnia sinensis]KAI9550272.1 hypothetical protein GHT06_006348 [Daphnia sinensis]
MSLFQYLHRSFPFNRHLEILLQQEHLTQLCNKEGLATGLAWLDLIALHEELSTQPIRYYSRLPEHFDHLLKSDDTWIKLDISVYNHGNLTGTTIKRTAYRLIRYSPEDQNHDPIKLLELPQPYTYWFNLPIGPIANLCDFKAIYFSPLIFKILHPVIDRPLTITIRLTTRPSNDDIEWLQNQRDNPKRHRCMYINCFELACCPTLLVPTIEGGDILPHKHCTSFFCPRCYEMCPINLDL